MCLKIVIFLFNKGNIWLFLSKIIFLFVVYFEKFVSFGSGIIVCGFICLKCFFIYEYFIDYI